MVARSPSPLLEREQETRLLRDAWRRTVAGHGSLWFLCTEAGGGKTRLANEIVRATGARTLWGAAEPVSPPEPYVAVCHAIPDFQPASSRAESVARAVTLLGEVAAAAPLILVLDDLHFADDGTVALVVRLSAECANRRWLVLVALRPGEGTAALHRAMTELVAQGQAQRLDLAPLTREGVGALVAGERGGTADSLEVEAIYADSGGNPWFVQALARGGGAVATARDRMLLRLDRLEHAIPGANAILAAVAPAPRPLPHAVVTELCGGDGPALRRVLVALRDAAVLEERDGGWGFRHELLRRSLLQGMIIADQQDAHRALAEVLESRGGTAAELAMLFAAAGDRRAVAWALRAAEEDAAIDAHREAMAQLERALSFDLEPEVRRAALRAAADAAWNVGRFADGRRLAEEGIAIPGGEPEAIAALHLRATKCARLLGDARGVDDHIDTAERALAGRPVSDAMVRVALVRLLRAAWRVAPTEVATTANHAIRLARALGDCGTGAGYEMEIRCYRGLSLLHAGDPAGLAPFERLIERATIHPQITLDVFTVMFNGYMISVSCLLHAGADRFRRWLAEAMQRHNVEWEDKAGAYHALESVQRGAFADARARLETVAVPPARTMDHTVLLCARALLEARAGSPARARALLGAADLPDDFAHTALLDLVRLELEAWTREGPAAALAADVYAQAEGHRYARVAGVSAVALARTGGSAPSRPGWLAAASPLGVFWDWAVGIERRDGAALRAIAARLGGMECPYEAALALGDAGDLGGAYRALTAIGATTARQQTAERLRAAGQPIPRRTRAALERDGLTETEREVARLVADGARNEEVAEALGVSVRTVESHLARIYQKTGQRGRVALANWWRERMP